MTTRVRYGRVLAASLALALAMLAENLALGPMGLWVIPNACPVTWPECDR